MEAWQSWTLFGIAAGGIGYYYATTGGQKKRGSGWKPFSPKQARARASSKQRNDSRGRKVKEAETGPIEDARDVSAGSPTAGGSESVKKRKGPKGKQQSKLGQSSAVDVNNERTQVVADDEEEENNLEFAKQLSEKKTGTSLKKPESVQNKKSRKQAKRTEAALAAESSKSTKPNGALPLQQNSTASSTTGGDADDDLSSANSADLAATNTTTPSGADTSDMLEPPAKGPSILRLTEAASPQPQRQPKAQKPAQEQETKKQRQNRRKREEEKAVREEAERERQRLLEKQRRTAREAEGRPAKNGLGTSQLPNRNAWSTTTKAGGNADTMSVPPPQRTELLDTFEEDSSVTTGQNASPGEKPQSNGTTYSSLPSEEEQMNMLKEMDSDNGWNTVAKGGKKKKANNPPSLSDDVSSSSQRKPEASSTANEDSACPKGASGTLLNAQTNGVAKAGIPSSAPSKQGKATRETVDPNVWDRSNIHEHPDYDPAFPYALTGHPDDSDWAVV